MFSPAAFLLFFAFRDTNRDTLVFLRPQTRDVATRVSGRKWVQWVQSTELDIVSASFCNLCEPSWLFGWRYISSLHSADELQQERNSCPLLRSCFIASCLVSVFKRFSRSTSLLSLSIFLADQVSCRSCVGSAYHMRSLAVIWSLVLNGIFSGECCNLSSSWNSSS